MFVSSGLQTNDPTHVCQCRQVERTRVADRVDVDVGDGTRTPFTDSDKPHTAVLISSARQVNVCGVVTVQDHVTHSQDLLISNARQM